MAIVRGILSVFAMVFDLLIAVFLLGVGLLGWLSGEEVHFEIIPLVEGDALLWTLVGAGALGIAAVLLAAARSTAGRILMLLWNVSLVSILVCAFTRPSYRFRGADDVWSLAGFSFLALLALASSWMSWRHSRAGS